MLHPATRRFLRESLRSTRSLLGTLHGYVYLRWPVRYIGACRGKGESGKLMDAVLSAMPQSWKNGLIRRFAESYHAKVMAPGTASRLIRVERAVDMAVPESVMPFEKARQIILDENAAVAVMDCPCRLSLPKHCEPVDVCILVGDTVVDFVLAQHPQRGRRITPDEAVDIVRRCNEQGMVTHAFFKEAVCNRFYAICNCCTCCCGALQGYLHGLPMLAASGFVAELHPESCSQCGHCGRICPFHAIDAPAKSLPSVNAETCMGCGVCVLGCKMKALHLAERGDIKPLVL